MEPPLVRTVRRALPAPVVIAVRDLKSLRGALRPVSSSPYPEQFEPSLDLPTVEGPRRIYLVASTPRSGSHLLGHMLASSGHFGVPLEYLNPQNAIFWRKRFGRFSLGGVFDELLLHRTGPTGLFGLKAHWHQFRPYREWSAFRRHGGIERVVWIHRRDLLGQAVSYFIAARTNVWIAGARQVAEAAYDYDGIRAMATSLRDENRNWRQHLDLHHAGMTHVVTYEELVADQPAQFGAVARFIDPDGPAVAPFPERTKRLRGDLNATFRERFLAEIRPEDAWIAEPHEPAAGMHPKPGSAIP